MIFDSVKNASRYAGLSENFCRAFEYLASTDLNKVPAGRYEIDGDNVYIMVQDAALKSWSEGRWEAHKVYADIQMVISGCERIGYAYAEDAPIETPYSPENDLLFYKEMDGNSAILHAGEMMVLFPSDAHRPCMQPSEGTIAVKKAVIKVRL